MYTNYNDMDRKLSHSEAFEGSSVFAKKFSYGEGDLEMEYYQVFSYNTCIFSRITCPKTGHVYSVVFDNRFYSMTTRRIQGIIRRAGIVPDNFPLIERGPRGGIHWISVKAEWVYGAGWKVA